MCDTLFCLSHWLEQIYNETLAIPMVFTPYEGKTLYERNKSIFNLSLFDIFHFIIFEEKHYLGVMPFMTMGNMNMHLRFHV